MLDWGITTAPSEPVEIALSSDGGFPWIGVLGPVAIVLAAIVAALYARHRMRTELAAADVRLEKQLKHDRESSAALLEAQLRHDRESREREATRTTLDELAHLVAETLDSCTEYWIASVAFQELRNEIAATAPDDPTIKELRSRLSEINARQAKSIEKTGAIIVSGLHATMRLRFRLADGHPVVSSFKAWHDAIQEEFDLIGSLGKDGDSKEQEDAIETSVSEAAERLGDFRNAVLDWIDQEELAAPQAQTISSSSR